MEKETKRRVVLCKGVAGGRGSTEEAGTPGAS